MTIKLVNALDKIHNDRYIYDLMDKMINLIRETVHGSGCNRQLKLLQDGWRKFDAEEIHLFRTLYTYCIDLTLEDTGVMQHIAPANKVLDGFEIHLQP